MKLLFFTSLLSSLVTSSLALACGEPCTDFSHEQGGLHVCSSTDSADIWNTTSEECLVSLNAKLKVVSHLDFFFTFGVAEVVRRNIGSNCWDYVSEEIAKTIIADTDNFNVVSVCSTSPDKSPSLENEMGYFMDVIGYSDCASVVILHQNFLGECVKNLKTLREFASVMYIIAVILGIFVFLGLCILACLLVEKYMSTSRTPPRDSPRDSPGGGSPGAPVFRLVTPDPPGSIFIQDRVAV